MPLKIIRNDITKLETDAIVNTANPRPRVGSGVDSRIYEAAGYDQLLAERRKIGEIKRGCAAVTAGFKLPAKYIIHAVGPSWVDGEHGEPEILRSAYGKSLRLASQLKCCSVAFPLISSGNYRFPKDKALEIALGAFNSFLLTSDMEVYLCVFDDESFGLSKKITADIDEFIDQSSDSLECLDDLISKAGESFNQRLFRLIDERGMDDVTVYKAANLDRKLFSKIRCSGTYIPKKKTILALAAALKLSADEAAKLLTSAGMAFSPSNKQDIIIRYCLSHGIFDINAINIILFEYGMPTLDD